MVEPLTEEERGNLFEGKTTTGNVLIDRYEATVQALERELEQWRRQSGTFADSNLAELRRLGDRFVEREAAGQALAKSLYSLIVLAVAQGQANERIDQARAALAACPPEWRED